MAVIKIVPMPGAKGDKGDDGATGAQGPQGPIGATGPAGADALWSYNGEWQSNATYAEGDLVTHDGQLYYATGITTLGVTPDLDSNFDLVAAKGADGEILQTDSISGTWDPQFYELNNIIPRLDGSLGHPLGPQSDYPLIANYYTIGDMVFFNFSIYLFDAIQWGAPAQNGFYRQFTFNLPFKHSLTEWTYSPLSSFAQSNPLATTFRLGSAAPFIGRLVVRNDMEPAGLGDNENFVIPVYGSMNLNNATQQSYIAISSIDTEGLTDVNAGVFKAVTSIWPVDLISPSATPNSKLLRLHVAGTYRKEPTDIATEIDQYIQGPQGIQGIQGPQGPQGEVGPQGEPGPQGAPGANGADALWNFVGEYNNGADYNIGDVVTYAGGTYYRVLPLNAGYPPGTEYWTTVAAPGAQGIQGEPGPQGEPGNSDASNTVRYSPNFTATGLAFTGTGTTYPTYNSYYVKNGKMVSFVIEVDCSTVTNFGTGQYKLQLPFTPAIGFNHFSGWAQIDTAVNPDVTNGHVILNVDHAGVTDVLDLHYLKQAGGAHTPIIEGLFLQGTPVTLTTTSKIYVNGTYICQ